MGTNFNRPCIRQRVRMIWRIITRRECGQLATFQVTFKEASDE